MIHTTTKRNNTTHTLHTYNRKTQNKTKKKPNQNIIMLKKNEKGHNTKINTTQNKTRQRNKSK